MEGQQIMASALQGSRILDRARPLLTLLVILALALPAGGCWRSPRFKSPFTLANPSERYPIAVRQGEMMQLQGAVVGHPLKIVNISQNSRVVVVTCCSGGRATCSRKRKELAAGVAVAAGRGGTPAAVRLSRARPGTGTRKIAAP